MNDYSLPKDPLLPARAVSAENLIGRVVCMDALNYFSRLPDASVHCIVTSPPYFGLRDYQTGAWEGGDADCQHSVGNQVQDSKAPGAIVSGVRPGVDASICRKCGARRVDQQIGLEPTPDGYVERLRALFAEARRVLRKDGVFWLNLGDVYGSSSSGQNFDSTYHANNRGGRKPAGGFGHIRTGSVRGMDKQLLLIPARVALALQADGWILRSEIIWNKSNSMPESVKDRPTRSHEHIFLFAKSKHYYFDIDSISTPIKEVSIARADRGVSDNHKNIDGAPGQTPHSMNKPRKNKKQDRHGNRRYDGFNERYDASEPALLAHPRSVWTIPTAGNALNHYAMMAPELARRLILSGCPEGGVVCDPFMGGGTTAVEARKLKRYYTGCDLNPDYVQLVLDRLSLGDEALKEIGKGSEHTLPLFRLDDTPREVALFSLNGEDA